MAGPSNVTVLDNDGDEDRVPTEEEVTEYAEFLGLDPVAEPHLMWIAREGVVAPVPAPWKACTENGDDVFYFNFDTGDSVWDHPLDEKYRQLVEEHRKKQADGVSTSPKGDSKVELPKDELDSLLSSKTSEKSGLSKAQGGLLDLGALGKLSNGNALGASAQTHSQSEVDEKKRLELITNEISEDEGIVDEFAESSGSPAGAAASSAQIDRNRGSAGVGLAASGSGGLGVDTSLDRSGELADRSMESAESSPVATSLSGAPSNSGGRSAPPLGPKMGSGDGKAATLERSGQSGKSSNLSEVSEDFPSDFERSETSPRAPGIRTPLGDSLEISATLDDGGQMALAGGNRQLSAEAQGSKPLASRVCRVQSELACLGKVLVKLREIREQQREYLHLLQSGS